MLVLQSDRMELRFIDASHLEDLHALCSDAEVMAHIRPPATTIGTTQSKLHEYVVYAEENPGLGVFAINERLTKEFMGIGVLFHLEMKVENKKIAVGYQFHKKFWNQGYATEVAKLLLQYGFDKMNQKEIYAVTTQANVASQVVLKKAGMDELGPIELSGEEMKFFLKKCP